MKKLLISIFTILCMGCHRDLSFKQITVGWQKACKEQCGNREPWFMVIDPANGYYVGCTCKGDDLCHPKESK